MHTNNDGQFDFERWARLAEESPEDFEAMRQAALEEFLAGVPEEQRERLRRLQWRVDQERRLAHTPMAACIRISRMMWQSLLGEGGLRDHLNGLQGRLTNPADRSVAAADHRPAERSKVVGFRRI